MSGINSLVGAADSTFSLPGSTGTWLDSFYRDGHSTWATEVAKNFDEYNSKENRPKYDPENDLGYTKMARATDPEWLHIISSLTNPLG